MTRTDVKNLSLAVVGTLVMWGIFLGALGLAANEPPKVPDETQIRILKIRNDQIQQEFQRAAIQAQYEQAYQKAVASQLTAIANDDKELRDIREQALKAASLDPAKFDLDVAKLEFVQKPTTAPPAGAK